MSYCVLTSQNEAATQALGAALAKNAQSGDVVLLTGDLGTGKTRFVQGAARELGILSPVTSPTFGLLEVYDEGRLPLYHFDLYRLETEDDLESIDFFALIEGDGIAFVEWADLFPDAMPDDALTLVLRHEAPAEGGSQNCEPASNPAYASEPASGVEAATPLICDGKGDRRVTIEVTANGARSNELLSSWESTLRAEGLAGSTCEVVHLPEGMGERHA